VPKTNTHYRVEVTCWVWDAEIGRHVPARRTMKEVLDALYYHTL